MKKTILIILVLAAVVGGCDKTKRTYNKIYGEYTLISYTVNGIDSLSQYSDSLGSNFNFYRDPKETMNVCEIYGKRKDGKETGFCWYWALNDNNKTLRQMLPFGWDYGIGVFQFDVNTDWEILELKKNNLKLKTTYNNKEYQIELE